MEWATQYGLQGTAQAVMDVTPDLCQVRHAGDAIRHRHYELAEKLLQWEKINTEVRSGVSQHSPIFAAVAMNHASLIERITELQGMKPEVSDYDGKTVLHHACENGHLELVYRFLKGGADPMLKSDIGRNNLTALDMAISHDSASARVAMVKAILSRKPALTEPHAYMRRIAKYDRLDVLNIFIEQGRFVERSSENWRMTLRTMLSSMAIDTFPKILELCPEEHFTDDLIANLLKNACYPNREKNTRKTRCIKLKISKLLMEHVRTLRDGDLSSLIYETLKESIIKSIKDDNVPMANYILSFTGLLETEQLPSDYFLQATHYYNPQSSEMLSVMIKHGFDVNQATGRSTHFMHALTCLKETGVTVGVVKAMIPMIKDIDQRNPDGDETALMHWLCPSYYTEQIGEALTLEITKLLLDNGASLSSRNEHKLTPLHMATMYCYPSVVKLLVDRGAEVSAKDDWGQTALHRATRSICRDPGVGFYDYPKQLSNAVDKIEILLNAEADPRAKSTDGTVALSPLDYAWHRHASLRRMVEVYTASAEKGGYPVDILNFLRQARHLLTSCAYEMCDKRPQGDEVKIEELKMSFELLLGYGFDINEHDARGKSYLDISLINASSRQYHDEDAPSTEEESWLLMYFLSKGADINAMNDSGKTILDRTQRVRLRNLLTKHGALPGSQVRN
ncbi:unnamed protein product [Clonostachys byssicola]|uniref:Ankyrin repeat protein n=1 Tax=Clonostachys byssicola TaxID=160290 RepID=A0A9N9U255_9HYPO|nr:unnamed protein product [Clonostachys byssicola]